MADEPDAKCPECDAPEYYGGECAYGAFPRNTVDPSKKAAMTYPPEWTPYFIGVICGFAFGYILGLCAKR